MHIIFVWSLPPPPPTHTHTQDEKDTHTHAHTNMNWSGNPTSLRTGRGTLYLYEPVSECVYLYELVRISVDSGNHRSEYRRSELGRVAENN